MSARKAAIFAATAAILAAVLTRLEKKMGAVADALAGVADQANKAKTEILGRLDTLEAQLDDAGKLDDADNAALAAVRQAVGDLDAIVPDAAPQPEPTPEPAPTPEPVAEPEPAAQPEPADKPDQPA